MEHRTQTCCNTMKSHTMPFNTIRYHAMPFLNGILELSRGADSAKSTGNLIFLNKRGGNDQCRWHKFEFPERTQWVNMPKYILKNKNISHTGKTWMFPIWEFLQLSMFLLTRRERRTPLNIFHQQNVFCNRNAICLHFCNVSHQKHFCHNCFR